MSGELRPGCVEVAGFSRLLTDDEQATIGTIAANRSEIGNLMVESLGSCRPPHDTEDDLRIATLNQGASLDLGRGPGFVALRAGTFNLPDELAHPDR